LWAEPILGKSGLIRTMIEADGLVAVDMNTEGLEKGEEVRVIPL
jgi:molybdopterin molybdotransferase